MDIAAGFATLLGAAKNFFWETQFVSLAEVILNWISKWKWLILFISSVTFVLLSVGNALLIGFVPLTEGEYMFRDVRSQKNSDWKKFSVSKGYKWKKHINTYIVTGNNNNNNMDKLSNYEIVSVSLYKYTSVNVSASVVEPVDNQFLVFVCRKQGKQDVFLTAEKQYGIPKINKAWRMFFPPVKKSVVYMQLSGNRNQAVAVFNDEDEGGYRHGLNVGVTVWRQKENSHVTVGRLLGYYTENSVHLSARYHMYFANSYHFVDGLVHIMKEMQEDDLRADVKSTPSNDFSVLQFLFNMVSRVVL